MDTHLVINWEKCHFMVKEGIVLGHKILKKGLEVDRVKTEVIERLEPPSSVKGIQSFLGHAGFRALCTDHVFYFNADCRKTFETLKAALISTPFLCAPNWSLPFDVMCDASGAAVGA